MKTSTLVALTLSLLSCGMLACNALPERTNPFDRNGIYTAADLEPQLAVAYAEGAVTASWTALVPADIKSYRLYRTIGASRVLLADIKADDPLTFVDSDPLPAATDIRYEVRYILGAGESDAVGTATLNVSDDVDGDGVAAGDCAFNIASIHPGAPETCNAIDDDCDGAVDGFDGPCDAGCDVRTCTAGAWGACRTVSATAEVCDGLDNDCNGAVDELPECQASCVGGCAAGELCFSGQCQADISCANLGDCPAGSMCVADLGVCANPCGPASCATGEACVAGACFKACVDSSACSADRSCVYGIDQPPLSGGCAPTPAACADCTSTCVRAAEGDNQCCIDADLDGFYALSCAWGDDCDDDAPGTHDGCDVCGTSDDCAGGSQCVLVTADLGVCGGPSGCHCPDGSACDTTVSPPACVTTMGCLENADCEQGVGAGFGCVAQMCECTDFAGICPQCVLDAECGLNGICNDSGQCE